MGPVFELIGAWLRGCDAAVVGTEAGSGRARGFGVVRGGGFAWLVAVLVGVAVALVGAPAAYAAAGTISTVAGDGTFGFSGDGGPATSAELSNDAGVAVDPSGDVLIGDYENGRVRLVAAASCSSGCPYGLSSMTKGDIYTVAGDGTGGISGDGGPATSAGLGGPRAITVDSSGDLLIGGDLARVRLVAWSSCSSGCPYGLAPMTEGDIYTVAGDGTAGFSGDGGAATSAELSDPFGVGVDANGDLLIAEVGNGRVRLVAASSCSSGCPYGLPSMTRGDIYTVAGDGTYSYSGDGGAATSAGLNNPYGVGVDAAGDLLIADTSNGAVRLVAWASCSSGCPYGLPSMTRGDIYTVAGNGTQGYSGDGGAGTGAQLYYPEGVSVDPAGDLLIGDAGNSRVRLVASASCSSGCPYGLSSMTTGDIYTVAGDGTAGFSGDGGAATSAELNAPDEIAVDARGDLLIADSQNVRVRMVTSSPPTPSISTSQQPMSAAVGSSIADQATVSGGDSPSGTVTFNLYNNPNATGTPLFTDANEPLSGGVATSKGYTTAATGTDYWVATYNGDSNNNPVSSGKAAEPVTITAATPSISTSQQPMSAAVGSSIADQATVSGGDSPSGTVTFNLYNNPNATGTPLFTDANEPLSGGVATSKGYTTAATGTDYWVATYNGDSNNNPVSSGKAAEPVTITSASKLADLSVAISGPSSAADGSSFSDQVTVKNAGPANAGNVQTVVLVPGGVTVTSTGGGKLGLGVVYWTASEINAGSKVTYTVTFKVSAHASGKVLIPAATVSFANPDPNYANNAAASTITLGSPKARNASARQARNPLKVGNRLPALLKELTHRHRHRHS